MKTMAITEEVSLHSDGKACWRSQTAPAIPRNRKNRAWKLKNGLANLWSRKKIKKKAYAGRGPETIWEMSE
jgi:hypothetical protein